MLFKKKLLTKCYGSEITYEMKHNPMHKRTLGLLNAFVVGILHFVGEV
jgi:hypothetical protein